MHNRRVWLKGSVVALADLLVPRPSYSQDLLGLAGAALAKYGPLAILAGGLFDHAIEKGEAALAELLRQVQAIIDAAIFNLNQALKERVQDIDEKVRMQREEAVRSLDRLADSLNGLLQGDLDQIDRKLKLQIRDIRNSVDNTLSSLPIPVKPLVNLDEDGMSVIALANGPTRLFVTGSGFLKGGAGFVPEAWVHSDGNPSGARLSVETASMGLLSIVIPEWMIKNNTTPQHYILSLGLKSSRWSSMEWPSFPLWICGALPRYTVRAKLVAMDGESWETRVGDWTWFYLDSDQHRQLCEITPEMLCVPGWEIDRSKGVNGLEIQWNPPTSPGGAGEHSEGWAIDKHSYVLWIGGHGGNNSHAYARAFLRRRVNTEGCGESPEVTYKLDYGSGNEISLRKTAAVGVCDTLLKTPNLAAKIRVFEGETEVTRQPITLSLPSREKTALNGQMKLSVDTDGLLKIALSPWCANCKTYRIKE
jgi:hypothetical protein